MTACSRRLPCLLVLVSAAAASAAEGTGAGETLPSALPVPLFMASFDGTAAARNAAGAVQAVRASGLGYAPGVRGQALVAGAKNVLEYPTAGNLVQEHGSITLWYQPEWSANAVNTDGGNWHSLLAQSFKEPRAGSGALMFWFWGPWLRGDLSDQHDRYRTASAEGMDPTRWTHLAFTWDAERGSRLFRDGQEVGAKSSDSFTPLNPQRNHGYPELKQRFASFFIGSQGGWAGAGGKLDEVRIYDRALEQPQVLADLAQVRPLVLDCPARFAAAGADVRVNWQLTNRSLHALDSAASWRITDPHGAVVASGTAGAVAWLAGEGRAFSAKLPSASAGEYRLTIESADAPASSASLWVLGSGTPASTTGQPGTEVTRIDFSKPLPPADVVVRGTTRSGSLNGRGYLEAGPKHNDRFAVHVTLPAAGVPYLVEWEYPDDQLRSMEMIDQQADHPDNDYGLQTGVFCGDEYPLSGKMLTHRSVFWARSTSAAFIFMTAREGAPAAVASLRVSTLAGLPDAKVNEAAPVAGWTRTLGMYFEDPSLGYDFGVEGQLMPDFARTLDRLVAYLHWSGQNLLAYPAVWYQGRMGPEYQPRIHPDGFIAAILAKFEANKLGFMPTINLQNIDLPAGTVITAKNMADGSLHDSPVMIYADGKPNPGGWHGTLPNFNPLHPAVRGYVERQIDELLAAHGDSPAFKGIIFHLTKHTIPWFGGLEAGYNDSLVTAFERDSGITVPVDHRAPLRGKLYADWLLAHAREQWIGWRCQQLADWYRVLAAKLAAKRPDLRLELCSYNPTLTDHAQDARFSEPGFAQASNRESGIDPALLADVPNLILSQTIYPADYRWSAGQDWLAKARPASRDDYRKPELYALLAGANAPWVNMHDRYFEDAIGSREPLQAPWLKEVGWRVATLNANDEHVMAHYLLPLRFNDVQGFTKGGFLVGTCGFEERLAAFARAYRALPASRFSDVPGPSATTRVRCLTRADGTWFYVANTERTAASATVVFTNPVGSLSDLATGQTLSVTGNRLTLELKPYELRAFKAAAGVIPGSCE